MTGGEIKWAFMHGVPVRLIDRVRGLDIWYPRIEEVVYRRDGRRVAVSYSSAVPGKLPRPQEPGARMYFLPERRMQKDAKRK